MKWGTGIQAMLRFLKGSYLKNDITILLSKVLPFSSEAYFCAI